MPTSKSFISVVDWAANHEDGGSWVLPGPGGAPESETGAPASNLKDNDFSKRWITSGDTYFDPSAADGLETSSQGLYTFEGKRLVGAAMVDVANPSKNTLARVIAGDPAVYRGVSLEDRTDELYQGGLDALSGDFTVEIWARIKTEKATWVANRSALVFLGEGIALESDMEFYVWATTAGQLRASINRYNSSTVLTSSLLIGETGELFYAAITVSGTTAKLFGMHAGGTLAELDSDTCDSAYVGSKSATLRIGSYGAAKCDGIEVYGFRLWDGIALSLSQLSSIAGRPARYPEDLTVDDLFCEWIFNSSDWGNTGADAVTDSGHQSNHGDLTLTSGSWVTRENDLVPTVDSGWVNIRGPWSDRYVAELGGDHGGETAGSYDTSPCYSVGMLVWRYPSVSSTFEYIAWFGQAPTGTTSDWLLVYEGSSEQFRLLTYRGQVSGVTSAVSAPSSNEGPYFVFFTIDPWGPSQTLHVNGVEDTDTPAGHTSISSCKLKLGRAASAGVRSLYGSVGPIVVCTSIVSADTMKSWLANGVPYDARNDIKFYLPLDEGSGTSSTDYGYEGATLTWDAVGWSRREYPTSVLGSITGGGRQHERISRLIATTDSDDYCSELWIGIHDPENPDGKIIIGRARAFKGLRWDDGIAVGAQNVEFIPGVQSQASRTRLGYPVRGDSPGPSGFTARFLCSENERNDLLRLAERNEPVILSVAGTQDSSGNSDADRRLVKTEYGQIVSARHTFVYLADKPSGSEVQLGIMRLPL